PPTRPHHHHKPPPPQTPPPGPPPPPPRGGTARYPGIQATNIYGGQGSNFITDPGSQTTIYGGPRANTITITATSSSGVVINGGPSTSTQTHNLQNGKPLRPGAHQSTARPPTVPGHPPPRSHPPTPPPPPLAPARHG